MKEDKAIPRDPASYCNRAKDNLNYYPCSTPTPKSKAVNIVLQLAPMLSHNDMRA